MQLFKWKGLSNEWFSLRESLLYYATITCSKENCTRFNKEICETTFKRCFANHKKSFNIPRYKNNTIFFTEYWALITNWPNLQVWWQIKRRYKSYNPVSRRRNLYLNAKLEILHDKCKNLLNNDQKLFYIAATIIGLN